MQVHPKSCCMGWCIAQMTKKLCYTKIGNDVNNGRLGKTRLRDQSIEED